MEHFDELISMGFAPDQIKEAIDHGFGTTNEIIDYIMEKKSKGPPPLVLKPLPSTNQKPIQVGNKVEVDEEEQEELKKIQLEAKKMHEDKLREREQEKLHKERLLNQIKEDRKCSSNQSKQNPPTGRNKSDEPGVSIRDTYKIRINLTGHSPIIETFNKDSLVQSFVDLLERSINNLVGICQNPTLTKHCITFKLGSWPRKVLNVDDYLSNRTSLLSLNTEIINSNIFIEHNATLCSENQRIEESPETNESPEEDIASEDNNDPDHMEMDQDDHEIIEELPNTDPGSSFHGAGQVLDESRDRNENYTQHMQEQKNRFINKFDSNNATPERPERKRRVVYEMDSLVNICLDRMSSIVSRVIQVTSSAQIGIPGTQEESMIASPSEARLFERIKSTFLPEHIANQILKLLKDRNLLNAKSAALLKNSLEELDLDSYPLISGDLIGYIARYMIYLRRFSANGIDNGSFPPNALNNLKFMKSLTTLSLNNLTSINSTTVKCLFEAPNLKSLSINKTKLNDAAWLQFTAPFSDNLEVLEVAGIDEQYSITDAGFWHLLNLFPRLTVLNASQNKIIGKHGLQPDSILAKRPFLKSLSLSGNAQLVQVPDCSSSIEVLSINQCYSLTLERLIEFAKLNRKTLKRVNGLFTIEHVTPENILEFYQIRLPFEEYDLGSLNGAWMTIDSLIEIMLNIDVDSIRSLHLPQRCISHTQDSLRVEVFIKILEKMKNLEELYIGDQLPWLGVENVKSYVRYSSSLKILYIQTANKYDMASLEESLHNQCKLRVQILV